MSQPPSNPPSSSVGGRPPRIGSSIADAFEGEPVAGRPESAPESTTLAKPLVVPQQPQLASPTDVAVLQSLENVVKSVFEHLGKDSAATTTAEAAVTIAKETTKQKEIDAGKDGVRWKLLAGLAMTLLVGAIMLGALAMGKDAFADKVLAILPYVVTGVGGFAAGRFAPKQKGNDD